MPAVLINCGAIILGSLVGILFSKRIPEKITNSITFACGGVLIVFIGLNIMEIKKIKTANYLPAVLFTAFFVLLEPAVKSLF